MTAPLSLAYTDFNLPSSLMSPSLSYQNTSISTLVGRNMGACHCTESRTERSAATLDESFRHRTTEAKQQTTQEEAKEVVFDFLTDAEKSMKSSLIQTNSGNTSSAPLPLSSIAAISVESNRKVTIEPRKNIDESRGGAALPGTQMEMTDIEDYQEYVLAKLTPAARETYLKLGVCRYLDQAQHKTLVHLNNGGFYIGDVEKASLPHGFGLRLDDDLMLFEGKWRLGGLPGPGLNIYPNGDYYKGSFDQGEVEGIGCFVRLEGASYDGEWRDSRQHGKGVETWADGSVYTGQFREGKKEGTGSFKWADGSKYEGEFRNNHLEGQGKYMWSDGRVYEGQWRNNKMHGIGKFTWPDGKVYEGSYVADQKCGFGVFRWPNGKLYEGNWQDNRMHGPGTVTDPRGKRTAGNWVNGTLRPSN